MTKAPFDYQARGQPKDRDWLRAISYAPPMIGLIFWTLALGRVPFVTRFGSPLTLLILTLALVGAVAAVVVPVASHRKLGPAVLMNILWLASIVLNPVAIIVVAFITADAFACDTRVAK